MKKGRRRQVLRRGLCSVAETTGPDVFRNMPSEDDPVHMLGLQQPLQAGSNLAVRPPSGSGPRPVPAHESFFAAFPGVPPRGSRFDLRPDTLNTGCVRCNLSVPRSSLGRPSRPAPGHVTPCVELRLSPLPRVAQRKICGLVTFLGDNPLELLGDIRWIRRIYSI